jgi:hypothetical protein
MREWNRYLDIPLKGHIIKDMWNSLSMYLVVTALLMIKEAVI